MKPTRESLIETARRIYANPSNDDIEIDDNAALSEADDGTWVQAWVWVRYKECDNEDEE